jgi:tetratricopeptide (TPR) repeat protein
MKIIIATATVVALGAATLLGGVVRESRSDDVPAAPVTPAQAASLRSELPSGDTVSLVRQLEDATRQRPEDARTSALLGLGYAQRARETGDAAFYTRAEKVFRKALRLEPRNYEATLGLGSVALSRHRFAEALEHGRTALALAPTSAAPLGIIGDAQLELGRYPAAFATFDRLAGIKPSVSAYARVAYSRELLGDTSGAIAAMTLAVDAAGTGSGEPPAWSRAQLGNLYLARQPRVAARIYRDALALRPGFAPALLGLGHTEEAKGKLREALALYRRSLLAVPTPDAAVAAGDVLAQLGRSAEAERAYARAHALEDEFAANGGRNDLETAMLDLDLDRNLAGALVRARRGHAERPSVEGEHVLAWALYKNGRCAEARGHSIRHLRLGTPDADGIYHRVLIERCLGNVSEAERFLVRLRSVEPGYLAAPPSAFRLREPPA